MQSARKKQFPSPKMYTGIMFGGASVGLWFGLGLEGQQ